MSSEAVRGISSKEFRHACGRFATGITIASVADPRGVPHGLTVSSFTSVSLVPPLISICLGESVTIIDRFRAASFFGINVLREDQEHLSEHFAKKGHDRFDGVKWHPGKTGAPLIDDVLASIECQVEQRVTAGDHEILIGRVVATHVSEAEGKPLLHFAGEYGRME
jgi:flavin reductase (DIM6/NTAB) family NADH-FMN oxidoreductase RutF